MSNKGKRYDGQPKLNLKKVMAVLILIAVIAMCIILIVKFAKGDGTTETKVVSNSYLTVYSERKMGHN